MYNSYTGEGKMFEEVLLFTKVLFMVLGVREKNKNWS